MITIVLDAQRRIYIHNIKPASIPQVLFNLVSLKVLAKNRANAISVPKSQNLLNLDSRIHSRCEFSSQVDSETSE